MRSPACGGLAVAVALGGACVDRRAGDLGGSGTDGGSGLDAGPWTDSGDSAGDTDAQCEDPPATLAEGALGEWGFGYVEHAAITGEWFDLADFDGDGTVDVFAGSADGARVYLQQCDGRFTLGPAIVFAERTTGSVSADFDGDGDIDLAALTTSQTPRFVANDGSGGFQDVGPTADFAAGVALPVALDLGADGTTELFIGGGHSEPGRILRLQADTSFAIVGMIPHPACYFTNAAAGDLDGDGRDDLVATGSCNAPREHFPLRTYRNDGADLVPSQSFETEIGESLDSADVLIVDVDADGDPDIVGATTWGLAMARNDGNGEFDEPMVFPLPDVPWDRRLVPLFGALGLFIAIEPSGTPPEAAVGFVPNAAWTAAATGPLDLRGSVRRHTDVNGDGRKDLAVRVG